MQVFRGLAPAAGKLGLSQLKHFLHNHCGHCALWEAPESGSKWQNSMRPSTVMMGLVFCQTTNTSTCTSCSSSFTITILLFGGKQGRMRLGRFNYCVTTEISICHTIKMYRLQAFVLCIQDTECPYLFDCFPACAPLPNSCNLRHTHTPKHNY